MSSNLTKDDARRSKSSTYAKAMGAYIDSAYPDDVYFDAYVFNENCDWWLRSPGGDYGDAAFVESSGHAVYGGGGNVDFGMGVRPAINLNLSSNLHTYAGTVSSDGTVTESGGTSGDTPLEPSRKFKLGKDNNSFRYYDEKPIEGFYQVKTYL